MIFLFLLLVPESEPMKVIVALEKRLAKELQIVGHLLTLDFGSQLLAIESNFSSPKSLDHFKEGLIFR